MDQALATDAAGFALAPELRMFRDTLRRFVDEELIPLEARRPRPSPAEEARVTGRARALGLWLLDVPEEWGGQGLGIAGQAVFWEQISRSVAFPPRDTGVFGPFVGPLLLTALNADQRERYLFPTLRGQARPCFAITEPDAGSDPGAIRTRAVRDGASYVVNGVKRFITGAEKASFAQLIAVTDPARGTRGMSCLLVDMASSGVLVTAQYETMMGDRPCEVVFEDVRVPAENLVGAEGDGFRLAQDWITSGRVLRHGARSCGIAERCLELGAGYAKQRSTFGAPLASRQAVQFALADTYAELQMVRLLVQRAAWKLETGQDARLDSWLAKTQGAEMGFRAADRCMQMHGGIGLTADLPIERMWRDQRSFMITEGPGEVMRAAIARQVLDQYG
jgi:acyl-CoA dehydrogenase